jgi:hypothetical protein
VLDIAVSFLADVFNADLLCRTGSATQGKVVPGSILDDNGKLAIASGTIALCLVNIEEERELAPARIRHSSNAVMEQPGLRLNLTLLFAARMADYASTLKALSHVLGFFQAHPVFTAENHPALDARLDRIIMESYPVTPETLNQIWSTLGANYQPSVLYRARAHFVDHLAKP